MSSEVRKGLSDWAEIDRQHASSKALSVPQRIAAGSVFSPQSFAEFTQRFRREEREFCGELLRQLCASKLSEHTLLTSLIWNGSMTAR